MSTTNAEGPVAASSKYASGMSPAERDERNRSVKDAYERKKSTLDWLAANGLKVSEMLNQKVVVTINRSNGPVAVDVDLKDVEPEMVLVTIFGAVYGKGHDNGERDQIVAQTNALFVAFPNLETMMTDIAEQAVRAAAIDR